MQLIADTLVALSDEIPLKKISVSDIVERAGKNRKTFYYHFENKDSLIYWIFRHDLAQNLQKHFPEDILVFEEQGEDKLPQFPYYITRKTGVRSLDHSEFFHNFSLTLEAKRKFYRQALLDNGPSSLRSYLYRLYNQAMRRDVEHILADRYLSSGSIQFLSEFYTCAFLYYYINKCCDQIYETSLIADAGPFKNIIHSSLEKEIQEAQLKRRF